MDTPNTNDDGSTSPAQRPPRVSNHPLLIPTPMAPQPFHLGARTTHSITPANPRRQRFSLLYSHARDQSIVSALPLQCSPSPHNFFHTQPLQLSPPIISCSLTASPDQKPEGRVRFEDVKQRMSLLTVSQSLLLTCNKIHTLGPGPLTPPT